MHLPNGSVQYLLQQDVFSNCFSQKSLAVLIFNQPTQTLNANMVKQLKQGKIYSANLLQFNSLYTWFSKVFSTLLSHTQTCFRRANLTNLVHTQEGFAGISKILVAFALYHDAGLGNPQILILEILILETSKIKFSKTIKIKNGMSVAAQKKKF